VNAFSSAGPSVTPRTLNDLAWLFSISSTTAAGHKVRCRPPAIAVRELQQPTGAAAAGLVQGFGRGSPGAFNLVTARSCSFLIA